VSGTRKAVERVIDLARHRSVSARRLPVACGFHSPLVEGARAPLEELAARLVERGPNRAVYSNVTAAPYPADPLKVPGRLGDHLISPVRFAPMIEAMYRDGARVFVEVGPGSVLTSLVDSILGERPHLAVASEPPGRKGLAGFLMSLGRLFVAGVRFDPTRLAADRGSRRLVFRGDRFEPLDPPLSPSTWMVNGDRARPAFGPEPRRFGPGPALPAPAEDWPREKPGANGHLSFLVPDSPHADHFSPSSPSTAETSDPVVAAFQRNMQTFLEVQRSTMLDFLAAHHAPSAPAHRPASSADAGVVSSVPAAAETPPRPGTTPPVSNGHADPAHPSVVATDRGAVEARLLEIVRERTGYPAEMLALDLDLEADLGIDSIKRVEILGTLRESLPEAAGSESDLMERLASAKSLGGIVEGFSRFLASRPGVEGFAGTANGHSRQNGKTARPGTSAHAESRENGQAPRVRRMVLEAVDAPRRPAELCSGGFILITDDGRGVAASLAEKLTASGFRPVRVESGSGSATGSDGRAWPVDLASPTSVAGLVKRVASEGPLAGVVHALPLRRWRDAGLDAADWDERMQSEVRGLFLLARACGGLLTEAARAGGSSLVAATALGGAYASVPGERADFFPGHGAIAGLVKTLDREWEGVRARVVDVDADEPAERLAGWLMDELTAAGDRAEVGYLYGRRIALRAVERELPAGEEPQVTINPGDPILITGGARGITAAVALDLARRWRPTLLLVGTSPLPPETEDPDLGSLTDPAAIKARLLDRSSRDRRMTPAELERAYQAFRRAREIRDNLNALRAAGAVVEYAQADVRDAEAVGPALEGWRARYGPPVGLIHGAGVIQDKLLRDKTPESFDRVVGTKLGGALTLIRHVDPQALRFTALFSSVAGRFGNLGQSDYAAANDALNKLALWLDRRWPGRVVSMIWGPWSGVGMVSELESHLGRRGLEMIPHEVGRSRLGDEVVQGKKGEVEVIVAGGLGNLVSPLEVVEQP
jgi:NAD(P)-dependent dehydrogenase (short-subunit alcohol dehydrogenase family)